MHVCAFVCVCVCVCAHVCLRVCALRMHLIADKPIPTLLASFPGQGLRSEPDAVEGMLCHILDSSRKDLKTPEDQGKPSNARPKPMPQNHRSHASAPGHPRMRRSPVPCQAGGVGLWPHQRCSDTGLQ